MKGGRSVSWINQSLATTTFDKNPSRHDHIHGNQPWQGHEVAKKGEAGADEREEHVGAAKSRAVDEKVERAEN